MKTIKIITYLVILIAGKIFSQTDFDYSGYLVTMPVYNYKNFSASESFYQGKINQFSELTRFRFRPVIYLWDGGRINMEYEVNLLLKDNSENFFLSGNDMHSPTQVTDLSWNLIEEKNTKLTHFIDRFYFRQNFDFGNIIVGRQRIAWGTGRIWNPTDFFNPINPMNFSKIEKDGADVISSKIIFGDFTDLHIVFNPDKLLRKSNYALRFRTNYKEYDFSFIGGVINNRSIAGFDFAGNFYSAGVRGEFIYSINKSNSEDQFVKYILGIDYQFTTKLYALIEFQFNGEGKRDKKNYELNKLIEGKVINLSRNYLAVSSSYELTPLLKLTALLNANLNDNSGFISLSGNYSLDDDLYLTGGLQISYGNKLSEYYFIPHSFYSKLEFYF